MRNEGNLGPSKEGMNAAMCTVVRENKQIARVDFQYLYSRCRKDPFNYAGDARHYKKNELS